MRGQREIETDEKKKLKSVGEFSRGRVSVSGEKERKCVRVFT